MIKFDLTEIPENASIKSAELSFYQIGLVAPESTEKCTVQTIIREWGESEVTWNVAKGSDNWLDDTKTMFTGKFGDDIYRGGNYDPADGIVGDPASTANEWENYDVTDRIQEMVNGERDNFGFLLKTWFHNAMERSYASSKADNVDNRPKLTITYDETSISMGVKNNLNGLVNVSVVNEGIKLSFNSNDDYNITLTTLSGKSVYSMSKSSTEFFIETKNFAKGLYLLKVSGNGISLNRSLLLK